MELTSPSSSPRASSASPAPALDPTPTLTRSDPTPPFRFPPTLSARATPTSITQEVADALAAAVALIPLSHQLPPVHGEVVEGIDAGFARLQDYAFTQGFALVTESLDKDSRVRIQCIHHHEATRNSRKTPLAERQRLQTSTHAKGCKYALYISYKKRQCRWSIGITHQEHCHPPNPDPFLYHVHSHRRPKRQEALQLAASLRGDLSYSKSKRILKKHGLSISRNDFYNLGNAADAGELTPKEELLLLLEHLDLHDFRVRIRADKEKDAAGTTRSVVKDVFFCSSEQIRLARRFVSGFMYQTDATFNTNRLRMPLSVLTGITNTGSTFPFAFVFICSESAASFRFARRCMVELIFYDCPYPRVTVGDFAKGLAAAHAAEETERQEREERREEQQRDQQRMAEAGWEVLERAQEAEEAREQASGGAEAAAVARGVAEELGNEDDDEEHRAILQSCEWHAAEAIRRRLVSAGKYPKGRREELIDLIWRWIKSYTADELEEHRAALLSKLEPRERTYLVKEYQHKEHQFVRFYTKTYLNLGVNSTQRAEGYHHVLKQGLLRNFGLARACREIAIFISDLDKQFDEEINKNRRVTYNLIDMMGFRLIIHLVTSFCTTLLAREWSEARRLMDRIETGETTERTAGLEVDLDVFGCQRDHELPMRYGLPCRCWMGQCLIQNQPIPLSTIHPRWLLDGPPTLKKPWRMLLDFQAGPQAASQTTPTPTEDRHAGDRFRGKGQEMTTQKLLQLQQLQQDLQKQPGPAAEEFAHAVAQTADRLTERVSQIRADREQHPPELTAPLPKENLRQFPSSRKRAMTGREAAEAQERDEARARRRAEKAEAAEAVVARAAEEQRRRDVAHIAAERERTRREKLDATTAAYTASLSAGPKDSAKAFHALAQSASEWANATVAEAEDDDERYLNECQLRSQDRDAVTVFQSLFEAEDSDLDSDRDRSDRDRTDHHTRVPATSSTPPPSTQSSSRQRPASSSESPPPSTQPRCPRERSSSFSEDGDSHEPPPSTRQSARARKPTKKAEEEAAERAAKEARRQERKDTEDKGKRAVRRSKMRPQLNFFNDELLDDLFDDE